MDFKKVFEMSDKTYDKLKYIALIILPAVATFFMIVAHYFNFDEGEPVAMALMVVDWLLGKILGISSDNYKKENES